MSKKREDDMSARQLNGLVGSDARDPIEAKHAGLLPCGRTAVKKFPKRSSVALSFPNR